MEKLKSKEYFEVVKCEDELPAESGRYYTDGSRMNDFYTKGNVGFNDDANWWLRKSNPTSGILLSETSLIELLREYKLTDMKSENRITLDEYREEYPKTLEAAKENAALFLKSKGLSSNDKPETK